ncbi:hypothetical protein GobsT_57270 [Gemmata obscuriglobus]|uniref:Carboxypeptidase regulatory-like domain-containing protein n=1 Tax=Gemmata obscuriglobus TaxID=114 RepID=A0A2Z3GT73_9BACT|nr:carboxypeptidase regulatory-like domain-containing protein [Gemmata obscuriglobus]AWM36468.1 hypothetical protein C1280_05150 [Gemmata obscuriglobus]QEG30909.1 hypothetical protein GobsT_57270 [Gemmata obscuriglobus]VTS10242.1 Uncharacterized protein OS=Singulisphaera acidiphila (strain ATCC BAA-1392 / DSM 18658 / VKM B-2454 / MOB10) GN=Sinac_4843 PE=4 SV=1 [Gemmata obscuriglobus UQM 2246]
MATFLRAAATALLFLALVGAGGCSDGPKIVPVSGTVTRNGQPVPHMTVNFEPATGRPSWGVSDESGRFTLEYDASTKGAVVGTHKVWVAWRPASPKEELDAAKGRGKKPADLVAIQQKYGAVDKSPLRVEVTEAVQNLDIKLD